MQFEIEFNLKNLGKFQASAQLDIAMFSKLFWEIGLKGGVVLWFNLVVPYAILSVVKPVQV